MSKVCATLENIVEHTCFFSSAFSITLVILCTWLECIFLNSNWWSGITFFSAIGFNLLRSNFSTNFDIMDNRVIGLYFASLGGFPGLTTFKLLRTYLYLKDALISITILFQDSCFRTSPVIRSKSEAFFGFRLFLISSDSSLGTISIVFAFLVFNFLKLNVWLHFVQSEIVFNMNGKDFRWFFIIFWISIVAFCYLEYFPPTINRLPRCRKIL